MRVFLKLRKWSLSLNLGVSFMIIDYRFLVKLHRFRSVSKKVIFTISFFTRPVFPSVFEKWKTRKTRFATWRHLCTACFWPFLALFFTFFTFIFENMKNTCFLLFLRVFSSFLEGHGGIREKRGLFWVFWRKNMLFYEISKTRKKNAHFWPYKTYRNCRLFFTFQKGQKWPPQKQYKTRQQRLSFLLWNRPKTGKISSRKSRKPR